MRARRGGRPRRPVVLVGLAVLGTLGALLVAGGAALVLGVRPVVHVATALDAPRTTQWRYTEQTWPQSYAATTCRAWRESMTHAQQTVAAAEMLVLALARDGWVRRPSDADVEDLRFNVSEVCAEQPDAVVGELGSRVYRNHSDGYRWGVETLYS